MIIDYIKTEKGFVKKEKRFRLQDYDYSSAGYYFVTIVTEDRKESLGEIKNNKMVLNKIGMIANDFWIDIPNHFQNIDIDEFIIMPNHLHGIIINKGTRRNAPWRVPTGMQPLQKNSLGLIINQFKGSVKRWCNKNNHLDFKWQSRCHDRIIRNDEELERIRQYIIDNPKKWELDMESRQDSQNISS